MADSKTLTSPHPLAKLIAYQEGAIVSRTLINEKGGSVTLFAFDAGERLSEHTAPYDALVYVLEGETDITIEGRGHRVRAGDVILLPAHKPHAVDAVTPFKMLLVMIRAGQGT